ncbi:postulated decoy of host sigma factor protein [Rhizobium phage RHph_I1_18]|nr:postulated decoy of host sigma factor protein [Rhizobium phage RHph_I1_18]
MASQIETKYEAKKREAASRGKEFTLTLEQFELLMKQQNCDYTGKKMVNHSLERVDNDKGYIPGNVIVVERDLNMLKSDTGAHQIFAKGAFKKEVGRLRHIVRGAVTSQKLIAQRIQFRNELVVERQRLRELMKPTHIVSEEHLSELSHQINVILTKVDEIHQLDSEILGKLRSVDEVKDLSIVAYNLQIISQMEDTLSSGEAQRKANAYFGIKEKPSVSQRLSNFSNQIKRLLGNRNFVERNVGTNGNKV